MAQKMVKTIKAEIAAQNRPKKGSKIKVQPFCNPADIKTLKLLLAHHPRNCCLFVLGINTGFRTSELLSITVKMVEYLHPGDTLEIKESKTGKIRRVSLNKACIDAIQKCLTSEEMLNAAEDCFLFSGQRGGPLGIAYVNRLVKRWAKSINLKGNYGAHTLRKTFGYHQRLRYKVELPVLTEVFGHRSQRQTLDYICVQGEEIQNVYSNEI